MEHILPEWCINAKKAMIDHRLNVTELAKELGLSRGHVSRVINAKRENDETKLAILKYLGLSA